MGVDVCCQNCKSREETIKFQVCGRCKQVKYCSRNCQQLDWKNHKTLCKDKNSNIDEIVKVASKQIMDESRKFIKRIHEKIVGNIVYLDVIQDDGQLVAFEYNKDKISELEEILARFSKDTMMETFKHYFSMLNSDICVVLVINAGIPFIQPISVKNYEFIDC